MRRIVVCLGTALLAVAGWGGAGVLAPSQAAASGSCSSNLTIDTEFTFINVDGNDSCTGSVQMSGTVLLQNVQGTDCGSSFGPFVSASGDANCTYNLAPPGTYTATFQTTMTTTDGSPWAGSSSECTGWGTSTLNCTISAQFVYVPGAGVPLTSISAAAFFG